MELDFFGRGETEDVVSWQQQGRELFSLLFLDDHAVSVASAYNGHLQAPPGLAAGMIESTTGNTDTNAENQVDQVTDMQHRTPTLLSLNPDSLQSHGAQMCQQTIVCREVHVTWDVSAASDVASSLQKPLMSAVQLV